MKDTSFPTYKWLLPLSWLYGFAVSVRNELFDVGWLKSRSFPIPVINVGNLTVGGTGKTPHTEYLIRLLFCYLDLKICIPELIGINSLIEEHLKS